MEIIERDTEDIIAEQMINELVEKINNEIIDYLFGRDIDSENYKKYRDKFDIIVPGREIMPYNVRAFIEKRINKEIEEGYLLHSYKDDDGNIINSNSRIPLDDIHIVRYIYDPSIDKNHIYRMHQTKHDYELSQKPLEPIFVNYNLTTDHIPTIGNFAPNNAYVNTKYAITNL